MGMLKSSEEFTLTVSFPGMLVGGRCPPPNTGTLHPITVIWKIKGGDKAYGFVNTPGLCDWPVQ